MEILNVNRINNKNCLKNDIYDSKKRSGKIRDCSQKKGEELWINMNIRSGSRGKDLK